MISGKRIIPAVLLVFCAASGSLAGRFTPEALLNQFEDGYGIVAAEIVSVTPVTKENARPEIVHIVFKVHDIAAQPTETPQIPLAPNDRFALELSVGYACQIEYQAPATGQKYFLAIKQKSKDGYELIDGASAACLVEDFLPPDMEMYAQARELAAIPEADRLKKWLDYVKDPKAPEQKRRLVILGLWGHLWPGPNQAGGQIAVRDLRKAWNDPASNFSIPLLEGLDYLLCGTDPTFAKSADRARIWVGALFGPLPELRKDDNHRDNYAMSRLRDILSRQPDLVAPQLMKQMLNPEWPPMYRRAISAALLDGFCNSKAYHTEWNAALQEYYASGLSNERNYFAIRMMAVDIKAGIDTPGAANQFVADPLVRAALRNALKRLSGETGKGPDEFNRVNAILDCQSALDALSSLPAPK